MGGELRGIKSLRFGVWKIVSRYAPSVCVNGEEEEEEVKEV